MFQSSRLVTPTLTFTRDNWSNPQQIMVGTPQDDNAFDDSATLTHTATGGDYDSLTADLAITIIDSADIIFGNVMTNNTLVIQEATATTYTVVLGSQPTADVTITIANDGDVSVQTLPLNFTTSDWDRPQTVTVSAAHDDDAVIDNVVLTHTAAGGDYASLTMNLEVIVIDDDTAGISFNPVTVTVNEEDNADYTVRLDTEPIADVIVRIDSDNAEVTVVSLASLTFTPDNWSTSQTITVTAADDDDAVDDSAILTHTATGGDYSTGTESVTANLDIRVDDNDTAGITFNPPRTVTVNEGANETYTVELDTEPSADVTIAIENVSTEIDYDTEVTVAPASLNFTPDNWSTPQTVTVTAGDRDDDNDDYMAIFSHTVATGNSDYFTGGGSITEDIAFPVTKNLRVTVNDLDTVSRDSKLFMLEISVNGDGLDSDLNPSFDPDETEYELIVDNRDMSVGQHKHCDYPDSVGC